MDATIKTRKEFEAERARWERLYDADPGAHVFLSWPWLAAYLANASRGWTFLLVRDGEELVAALPVRITNVPSALLPVARQLSFAASTFADYEGMLCLPGREAEAIAAFAGALRRMRWDRAMLNDVIDPRIGQLLRRLEADGSRVQTTGTTPCLSTRLPPTWAEYVKTLGNSTRSTTVRSLRRMSAELPGFRVSSPTDSDIDAHVDAMVRLNHQRWGGNLRRARANFGRLHRAAYDTGCLRLIIVWDGGRAVAGAASYVDRVRGTYNLYKLGYDPAYAKYSPGKGVIGLAIRDAIDQHYSVFDFLRGAEDYKSSYAHDLATTTHYRVRRRSLRSSAFDAIHPAYRAVKVAAIRVVYGPGRIV